MTERREGLCHSGVIGNAWGRLSRPEEVTNLVSSRRTLGRAVIEGDSPVGERFKTSGICLSTTGHGKPCGKSGGPPSKAKYSWSPIAYQYREGKVKRTPSGE